MKILIMCEGANELKIIDMLLDADKLSFTQNDLLDMRPFHARQLSSPNIKPALDSYHGELIVFRIGDKMSDKFTIPKELRNIVTVQKYCTLPELEMLLIIAENLVSEFNKAKSTKKPKTFCKENIKYKGKKYDNSTEFYENYFGGRIDLLIKVILKYRQNHGSHKKDEGYLADLLK